MVALSVQIALGELDAAVDGHIDRGDQQARDRKDPERDDHREAVVGGQTPAQRAQSP